LLDGIGDGHIVGKFAVLHAGRITPRGVPETDLTGL
jgi:hypothetical protein